MTSRFILPFADVGSGIKPSSGAKLFFFKTDGVTPKDTFSDQLSTPTPNANPVIADSNGVFGDIYIEGQYKVTLQDKNGSQIFGGAIVLSTSSSLQSIISTTLISAKSSVVSVGQTFQFSDRGNGIFKSISGTGAATGFGVVAHDTQDLSFEVQTIAGVRYADQFGAADGIPDSFGPIDACIRDLPEGGKIYLPGGDLNLGTGNTLRDDVLNPTGVGITIMLIGVGSSEDQSNSGKITTLTTTGGSIAISFDGNRSGGRDFAVRGDGGSLATAAANIIVESSRAQWENIVSINSRGSGLWFRFGNNSSFKNITCLTNGYRGFDADGTGYINKAGVPRPNDLNASVFINIDVRANDDIGFRTGVNSGFSNFYYNITSQGNGGKGLQFNGDFNRVWGFYGEANGGDLVTAPFIVAGSFYEIVTVGTTDYTLIGAPNNDIGTGFNSTGIGAGTGTAIHSIDIEFSSTADNNFVWGAFFNSAATGATMIQDLSVNKRNFIDIIKATTGEQQVQRLVLGLDTSPAGNIVFDGEGDSVNPSITLEGTGGSQNIEVKSSGAGKLKFDFQDGIVLEAPTAPTLINSWVNFGGSRKVAGFYKDALGIVHLEGVISGGIVTSPTIMFVLPVGYRPAGGRIYYTTTSGMAFAGGFIETTGEVYIEAGVNTNFSLDSITFRSE